MCVSFHVLVFFVILDIVLSRTLINILLVHYHFLDAIRYRRFDAEINLD